MISKIIRIIIITIVKGIVRKYLEGRQKKKEPFKKDEELEYEVLDEENSKFSTIHYQGKVEQLRRDIERGQFKN